MGNRIHAQTESNNHDDSNGIYKLVLDCDSNYISQSGQKCQRQMQRTHVCKEHVKCMKTTSVYANHLIKHCQQPDIINNPMTLLCTRRKV